MSFQDISDDLRSELPELRGRLETNVSLSDITWFRVGGCAQILYSPADEADLAYFLKTIPDELPVKVIGLGSNLLVRDGGVPGIVIRLGRGFNNIEIEDQVKLRIGTAVPDVKVSRAAADAEISGLSFLRGIPGGMGGALRMNAGAHGTEIKDIFLEARAVDRHGEIHVLTHKDMGFTYRHCDVPQDWIFTQALLTGKPGNKQTILQEMNEVAEYREQHQPIKGRTGGSTFKNPPDNSAWKLVDEAGCRGLQIGGAQVSEMHCNFLLNIENATAKDLENLGETVRQRVKEQSGIELQWEIQRLGIEL